MDAKAIVRKAKKYDDRKPEAIMSRAYALTGSMEIAELCYLAGRMPDTVGYVGYFGRNEPQRYRITALIQNEANDYTTEHRTIEFDYNPATMETRILSPVSA